MYDDTGTQRSLTIAQGWQPAARGPFAARGLLIFGPWDRLRRRVRHMP
jgi:hypothetical protein